MKTEQQQLYKQLNERFIKAFATYRLLSDGDRVLVGLSGGKDSLLLTELLARRSRISHPAFEVEAVHVRMENISYETDTTYLQQFCDSLGVPLHIVTTSFSITEATVGTAVGNELHEKPACFLCSWHRRKQLFNLAQQLKCNKLALGHHQDDVLHTALMNLFYQGRFDTMPACLPMAKMPLTVIRPLILIPEPMIQHYALLSGYQQQVRQCPYEHDTNRTAMSKLLQTLENDNPEVRHSLWRAIRRAGLDGEPQKE